MPAMSPQVPSKNMSMKKLSKHLKAGSHTSFLCDLIDWCSETHRDPREELRAVRAALTVDYDDQGTDEASTIVARARSFGPGAAGSMYAIRGLAQDMDMDDFCTCLERHGL